MKTISLTVTSLFVLSLGVYGQIGSQLKYQLPDVKLTATQLCGKDICTPGNVGKLLHYTKSGFSPAVKKATTAEDVALQILGKTLPSDKILYSKDFSTCSELSDNPFSLADIENVSFPDGRTIEYQRKEKLEINVSSAVDANLKELLKLTSDSAVIERLKAKIQIAYSKVKGKELTVIGKYSEWQLAADAREQMKKGDGFQECRKWIEDNNERIILAVGLVYFEITYEQNSVDQLAAEIDAELAREGIAGSLSFSFKREITKRFKSSNDLFKILIVRHAGIKGKSFVEAF